MHAACHASTDSRLAISGPDFVAQLCAAASPERHLAARRPRAFLALRPLDRAEA
jgi:hypothetical protein